MSTRSHVHQVVIVGGGFAGLDAALRLRRAPVRVTLVDRRNFHLFQPLLYQVATGALSPANIAAPLRAVLRKQKNTEVVLANVVDFDPQRRVVVFSDGRLPYDTLVVAAGATHSYFGHDKWQQWAPGLKTVEDATQIRAKILRAFECAEREPDPANRAAWLTFTIVGGGPTGVELAGALSEIANHTLKHDFRNTNPADANIVLIESDRRVLAAFPEQLSDKAAKMLQQLNVAVRMNTKVTEVAADHVVLTCDSQTESLPTRTVLWAAGVQASPLGRRLAERTGAEVDRSGRVVVSSDLTLPGHPEIFVLGDLACCRQPDGTPLSGLAPVAMQQGRYVAKVISRRLRNKSTRPFIYRNRGIMATIGRSRGVAEFGRIKFSGWLAWILWLFVHLMHLVLFQNRLLVLIQWAWSYFTYNRTARLITGANVDSASSDKTAGSPSADGPSSSLGSQVPFPKKSDGAP